MCLGNTLRPLVGFFVHSARSWTGWYWWVLPTQHILWFFLCLIIFCVACLRFILVGFSPFHPPFFPFLTPMTPGSCVSHLLTCLHSSPTRVCMTALHTCVCSSYLLPLIFWNKWILSFPLEFKLHSRKHWSKAWAGLEHNISLMLHSCCSGPVVPGDLLSAVARAEGKQYPKLPHCKQSLRLCCCVISLHEGFELSGMLWLCCDLSRMLWERCGAMCVDEQSCLLGAFATTQWNSSRWAATATHMPPRSRAPMLVGHLLAGQQLAAQLKAQLPAQTGLP